MAQESTQIASNPIVWADMPDASIIRVGDSYYMSSTTMHLSPGLPIMKSKNLVDWEIIGYAYDILEDNDQLSLRNGKNSYGAGSWASSLRFHNGVFYVSTFSSSTGKTHVYTCTDIEKGDWKEKSFSPALHDHSLFFDDDGRIYMLHGVNNIHLTELLPDVSGIKPNGIDKIIVKDASLVAAPKIGLPAEGTQLFKINGMYYLCNITWPPNDMRTQIVHRADKIDGPYQGRIILKDQGIAQGGLIDTPSGDWYAYLFQDCGAVGRIPFLIPLKWEDGWPLLGINGKAPTMLNISRKTDRVNNIVASDEFERTPSIGETCEAFPLAWQWNHNPDNRFWSLTERPNWLRLKTGRIDKSLLEARNTLTQRTFGPKCSATTLIDVSNIKNGDFAGIAAFQKQYGFVGVKKQGDSKSVVMSNTDENGAMREVENIPIDTNLVYLKIECDFKDRRDEASFYWSLDGKEWKKIGSILKMRYTLPHFMGYRFALFNFATEEAGGWTDFDFFRVGNFNATAKAVGYF